MFKRRKRAALVSQEGSAGRRPRVELLGSEEAKVFDDVRALHVIAEMPLAKGDSPELVLLALDPLEEAIGVIQAARKDQGDKDVLMALQGQTLCLMGHVYMKAQRTKEARRAYDQALSVYERAGLLNDADRVRGAIMALARS